MKRLTNLDTLPAESTIGITLAAALFFIGHGIVIRARRNIWGQLGFVPNYFWLVQ